MFYEINCILIVQGLYVFRLLGKYFYTTAEIKFRCRLEDRSTLHDLINNCNSEITHAHTRTLVQFTWTMCNL